MLQALVEWLVAKVRNEPVVAGYVASGLTWVVGYFGFDVDAEVITAVAGAVAALAAFVSRALVTPTAKE